MSDELTLDPSDWDEFRRLAREMVDDMIDHFAATRERPVWRSMPPDVRSALDEPVPWEGEGAESAYQSFVRNVRPYPNGNAHPRFFGWVQGNGTPLGMMADMLASGLNPHLAGFDQAPTLVEKKVVQWMVELMGFPSSASGLLTGGASLSNLLALSIARYSRAGFDVRTRGLYGSNRRLTVYASGETHGWLDKAVELLGLGTESFRRVPHDSRHRIDVNALRKTVRADRARESLPFCVVANAGTVSTGATDDLRALGELCREEELWLHVDGAFGALARWSERLRDRVAGIADVDSVAFDLHKWVYQPFTVACLLVRDGEVHRSCFATKASYLSPQERGVIAGGLPFADLGIELTREFRALKVWMSLKAHGVRPIVRLIEQNVEQAELLGRLVEEREELELLAPVELNIVCFRFAPERIGEERALADLNREILLRIQESGVAVPSSASLGGRFALRCAFTNHRTRLADVELLVDEIIRIGRQLTTRG